MKLTIKRDSTGTKYIAANARGRALLLDPFLNKDMAFTEEERQNLHLQGLLPPRIFTIKEQLEQVYEQYQIKNSPIEKYIYLVALQGRNRTLFYRLLSEHIEEMMPIIYTPTVGEACERFSHIYRRAHGLYITYNDKDRIEELLQSWNCKEVSIIVVTDGERILGLGDLGANGMGIPMGKLSLYTLCAGVPPYPTLPILLDVGTDNPVRLNDPLYIGLRQKRIRSEKYQEFIDSFVRAVKKVFPEVLLQWEDFYKDNALHQLERFRNELCTFNDDIQGTAAVALAGIFGALKITKQSIRDQRIVFAGAGAAANGIADLIVLSMKEAGANESEARKHIWMMDRHGLVTEAHEHLEEFKKKYARAAGEYKDPMNLLEVVCTVKPTILIGVSATKDIFTKEIIEEMTRSCGRPIIFPLSNPTSRSECTPEIAIRASLGKAIVATGSPFEPVVLNGKKFRIGQGNNAYIFPGMGLAISFAKIRRVSDGLFLIAAKALAELLTQDDINEGAVYPSITKIRECSKHIAVAVVEQGVKEGLADFHVLDSLGTNLDHYMWFPDYLPIRYEEL